MNKKITVIMPAYNLEHVIVQSIQAVSHVLEKNGYNYEIVVVDDGSEDNTYKAALRATKNTRIRVYRLLRNKGKGFALLYGFMRSTGDIIIFFDADLDINPNQIPLLIKAMEYAKADMVITSKWHPKSITEATMMRKILSRAFNALTKLLLGIDVSDTQTGAKAIKRKALEDILHNLTVKRYAFDVELITAVIAKGYKIIEIPALWKIKLTSKFKIREIIKMFIDLMAIAYRHRIKKQYIGAVKS